MKVVKLRIDGQQFHLPAEVDLGTLQEQMLDAVTGQAAFVSFRTVGHGEVSVLVTAHVSIRFDVEERSEWEVDAWAEDEVIDARELFPVI